MKNYKQVFYIAGLETGRMLTIGENSLAAELDIMFQDEVHKALKEQQEVNLAVKNLYRGYLLNIVETIPSYSRGETP
ncbi:hypothetical protein NQ317_014152 [Molorchus minor]|uniref:Uncharacterized protein n=1 Tax=Molorchus minor TaxID=1323400 RepID=A0ABQ9J350_9CUCU|nr:hypothetical protein NQ317_014152 [Molorchus minor]